MINWLHFELEIVLSVDFSIMPVVVNLSLARRMFLLNISSNSTKDDCNKFNCHS